MYHFYTLYISFDSPIVRLVKLPLGVQSIVIATKHFTRTILVTSRNHKKYTLFLHDGSIQRVRQERHDKSNNLRLLEQMNRERKDKEADAEFYEEDYG